MPCRRLPLGKLFGHPPELRSAPRKASLFAHASFKVIGARPGVFAVPRYRMGSPCLTLSDGKITSIAPFPREAGGLLSCKARGSKLVAVHPHDFPRQSHYLAPFFPTPGIPPVTAGGVGNTTPSGSPRGRRIRAARSIPRRRRRSTAGCVCPVVVAERRDRPLVRKRDSRGLERRASIWRLCNLCRGEDACPVAT